MGPISLGFFKNVQVLYIWHRLLIYSMIFNICVEWVTVNIEMPIEHNIVVWSVMAVTLLIIIASIVLRFKTGCFENERNSGQRRCVKAVRRYAIR